MAGFISCRIFRNHFALFRIYCNVFGNLTFRGIQKRIKNGKLIFQVDLRIFLKVEKKIAVTLSY